MSDLRKILQQAQNGKRKAQMAIYDHYQNAVFNSCYRILNQKEDAEDICHDTFIHIFNKNINLPDQENITPWLRRIGINKSIDFLRRQQKIEISSQVDDNQIEDSTNEDILQHEIKKIYNSILQLPERYRIIVNLYLIEGYDHNEISEILNISNSTSRSQLSRAKQLLKQNLLNQ